MTRVFNWLKKMPSDRRDTGPDMRAAYNAHPAHRKVSCSQERRWLRRRDTDSRPATVIRTACLPVILIASLLTAEAQPSALPSAAPAADQDYRLRPMDTLAISVFGESDLSIAQRIDSQGMVSIPLLGDTKIAGLTVREAETFLEQRFVDEEYLKHPQVTVNVTAYSTRQFFIFGQVQSPGAKPIPIESGYIDIIEAISMAGDFTDTAKTNAVRVTRKTGDGAEITLTWNLDGILKGDESIQNREKYRVEPGDLIFVPERIF